MSQVKLTRSRSKTSPSSGGSGPELLTLNEVMERLKIGRTTLRFLIDRDPDFVTIKLGERRLMSVAALEAFVKVKEEKARGERPAAA